MADPQEEVHNHFLKPNLGVKYNYRKSAKEQDLRGLGQDSEGGVVGQIFLPQFSLLLKSCVHT